MIKKNAIQAVFLVSPKGNDFITNNETGLVPNTIPDNCVMKPTDSESFADTSNSPFQQRLGLERNSTFVDCA